jgi:hypothetical protein
VLGTTRALGLARNVARHGVRTTTLYQPIIDYPELNMAAQITDDQHTPYNTWSRWEDIIIYRRIQIRKFLGLKDTDPKIICMDQDPDLGPSINKQRN